MGNPFQNFKVLFKHGEPVFSEGENGDSMFIIQSGKVGLYRKINGHPYNLGTMEKGDFFGEMSILEGRPRAHTAVAESDTELIEINNTIFDKMIRGNIEIAVRMLRKLSIRLREAELRLQDVSQAARPQMRRPDRQIPNAAVDVTDLCGVRLETEEQQFAFPLRESETLIGRYDPVTELKPDIDLTELDLKRSVSRQHAKIIKTREGYLIKEEVGALNGTSVNGKELEPGQTYPIVDGDKISVGNVPLTFRSD